VIENRQFARVNNALGVMQHDGLVALPRHDLGCQHGTPQMVQAIGLGGRAGGATTDTRDPRIADRSDRRRSGRILQIDPDEDAVVRIIEAAGQIAQHRADHRGLVPSGDDARHPAELAAG